mgnify:CR=1 FL=1
MDEIRKYRVKSGIFFTTGLIAGFLLGIVCLVALVSYRVDTYHKEISLLKLEIGERDIRLDKLQKTINSRKLILNSIEVQLNFNGDQIDKIEIEKYIKEKYAKLISRDVKGIDIDMVADVIDKRIIRLKVGNYRLRVEKLALTEILKLWVTVEKVD